MKKSTWLYKAIEFAMSKLTLRERLIRYMQRNHTDFVPSGTIQKLVMEHTTYLPRTAVRRLEELAEEGILEVKIIKRHAHYRYNNERKANLQNI